MFSDIASVFGFIPFKKQFVHMYNVHNHNTVGNGNYKAKRERKDEDPVDSQYTFLFRNGIVPLDRR